MTLSPRQRSRLYLVCCFGALGCFHLAFLSLGSGGLRVSVPLAGGLLFSLVAGGYVWPPIGNKVGLHEAGRHLGWSAHKRKRVYLAMNLLAIGLIGSAIVGIVTG